MYRWAQRIVEAMTAKGWSQTDLANAVGTSQQQIARYESGGNDVCDAAVCHWTILKNLRHSHATIMLSAGVDVVTVSSSLGHSSVSVTDRFYLRPRRASDEGAERSFDALVVATARDSGHLRAKKLKLVIESC